MPRIDRKQRGLRVEELEGTLESINEIASDADDAGLTREEVIAKVREIAELAEAEDEETDDEAE